MQKMFLDNAPEQSEQQIIDSRMMYSIKERKQWAEDMLERFKKRNISLGINAQQSMWLHHRMRALEITFAGIQMTEDILNMAVSGDIETACLSLMNSTVDDGTKPYHWYTEDTRKWLIDEMKVYLGWV
jgi:hypothetical protein